MRGGGTGPGRAGANPRAAGGGGTTRVDAAATMTGLRWMKPAEEGSLEPLEDSGQLIRPQDSWTRVVQSGEDFTFSGLPPKIAGMEGHSIPFRSLINALSGCRAL